MHGRGQSDTEFLRARAALALATFQAGCFGSAGPVSGGANRFNMAAILAALRKDGFSRPRKGEAAPLLVRGLSRPALERLTSSLVLVGELRPGPESREFRLSRE